SITESIDTETPTGRAMWQMIGVLAELERSLISERTRAGVIAARARGVRFERRPKLSRPQINHARKLINAGEHSRGRCSPVWCWSEDSLPGADGGRLTSATQCGLHK